MAQGGRDRRERCTGGDGRDAEAVAEALRARGSEAPGYAGLGECALAVAARRLACWRSAESGEQA